jgi:hypothetical protein
VAAACLRNNVQSIRLLLFRCTRQNALTLEAPI